MVLLRPGVSPGNCPGEFGQPPSWSVVAAPISRVDVVVARQVPVVRLARDLVRARRAPSIAPVVCAPARAREEVVEKSGLTLHIILRLNTPEIGVNPLDIGSSRTEKIVLVLAPCMPSPHPTINALLPIVATAATPTPVCLPVTSEVTGPKVEMRGLSRTICFATCTAGLMPSVEIHAGSGKQVDERDLLHNRPCR
jgi:hypothetical protein